MKEKGNFIRMLGLYKPYKALTCLVLFGVILQSAIDLVWPAMTRYILNNLLSAPDFEDVKKPMIWCFCILVGVMVLNIFSLWILCEKASILTDNIKYGLQKTIFGKYTKMSFSYFDNVRGGEMITMLNYDIDKIDQFVYVFISRVLTIVFTTVGAIFLFSSISLGIMAMILPLLLALILFNKVHTPYLIKAFKKMREKDKIRMEEAEDKISGIRTVIAFGKEDKEYYKFSGLCNSAQEVSKVAWRHSWIRNVAGNVIFNGVYYIILLFIGGIMSFKGLLSLADLTVFMMYSYLLSNPVRDMMDVLKTYNKANASFDNVVKFLDAEPEITNPKIGVNDSIKGDITFDHCSFKYNSSDEMILNDFSLNIPAGKYVAIVGPSGSGKSTIAGLIPRYYDVVKGNILIDGFNIKDFYLSFLRKSIGVVQQDIYLFYGSIYDNIAYGLECATREDVVKAAKLANAHEFISKLPNGYNTNIGDRGVRLSGGQKQRIAIARALMSDPPIIIFDEATSALDNESEREVQKAMNNIAGTRTVIAIAHRLSTIKNADEIIFLTDNGIEEKGSHAFLMEKNGKYADMYNASIKE